MFYQVTNQAEWDALPSDLPLGDTIEIRGVVEIEARGSSSVVARESSRVVARGSSSVEAWESSRVVAWEFSSVVARDSSSVVARDSSRVVARESSRVVAWGSSSVEAWGSSSVDLAGYAVAWKHDSATVAIHAPTAHVQVPRYDGGTAGWLAREGIVATNEYVVLYKRVSAAWLTQENTSNQTQWAPGTRVEHPAWDPTSSECGPGKFHACATPYLCDDFRDTDGDRYVAIRVAVADLHAWDNGQYPHKVAFRAGDVLHEVDRWGERL